MTEAEEKAIRERRAKVVAEKWGFAQTPNDGRWCVLGPKFTLPPFQSSPHTDREIADFIAHAPTDIDALLAEVDRRAILSVTAKRVKPGR